MNRYQIVYSKRGVPLIVWLDDRERTCRMAAALVKAGYIVSVWEHTENGAKEIAF